MSYIYVATLKCIFSKKIFGRKNILTSLLGENRFFFSFFISVSIWLIMSLEITKISSPFVWFNFSKMHQSKTSRSHILKQTCSWTLSVQLQVYLSMCDFFVTTRQNNLKFLLFHQCLSLILFYQIFLMFSLRTWVKLEHSCYFSQYCIYYKQRDSDLH